MLASFNWDVIFTSPFSVGALGIIAFFVAGIVSTIMSNWRKVRVAEQTAALKQSMVNRGMSADEIERVLKAGTTSANGSS